MGIKQLPDIMSEAAIVNQDTIQLLERYLQDARDGNVTEIIMVGMNPKTELIQMASSKTLSTTNQLGCLAIAKENVLSHIMAGSVFEEDDEYL